MFVSDQHFVTQALIVGIGWGVVIVCIIDCIVEKIKKKTHKASAKVNG